LLKFRAKIARQRKKEENKMDQSALDTIVKIIQNGAPALAQDLVGQLGQLVKVSQDLAKQLSAREAELATLKSEPKGVAAEPAKLSTGFSAKQVAVEPSTPVKEKK
jgi:mevalonate kinase